MEKIYQIAINASVQELDELICLLNLYDIKYETGILLFFEVCSKNKYAKEILKLSSEKFNANINVFNKYSPREIKGSKYLVLGVNTHSAYPQPESRNQDGQNYIDFTYDTLNSCQFCGYGKIQYDSFYLKKNFIIKNAMKLTQLYWIYDTFFVSKTFKNILEKEKFTGIEIVPSKYIQDRKKREDLFQIRIKDIFPLELKFETRKTNTCNYCKHIKYVMKQDSLLFHDQNITFDGDFYLSQEFFGDGFACFQLPIISQRLYTFLEQNKVKNMIVHPIFEITCHQSWKQ